jgi:hypothetical protein
VGGRRLIPEDYLPEIEAALQCLCEKSVRAV